MGPDARREIRLRKALIATPGAGADTPGGASDLKFVMHIVRLRARISNNYGKFREISRERFASCATVTRNMVLESDSNRRSGR